MGLETEYQDIVRNPKDAHSSRESSSRQGKHFFYPFLIEARIKTDGAVLTWTIGTTQTTSPLSGVATGRP